MRLPEGMPHKNKKFGPAPVREKAETAQDASKTGTKACPANPHTRCILCILLTESLYLNSFESGPSEWRRKALLRVHYNLPRSLFRVPSELTITFDDAWYSIDSRQMLLTHKINIIAP